MNDPCPCGSGKKYKKCCFYKESMSDKSLIYAIVMILVMTNRLRVLFPI